MTRKLDCSALTPFMGAELHDIDLAEPVDEVQADTLRRALAEHTLLLVRGQNHLTAQQHITFSQTFGALEAHVLKNFCLTGHPEIFVVSNIIENGQHIGAYGGSKVFHSDLMYLAHPSLGSVFRCHECPEEGGETAFASLHAAFDALPAARKEWLAGRRVVYDYVWHYARAHTARPAAHGGAEGTRATRGASCDSPPPGDRTTRLVLLAHLVTTRGGHERTGQRTDSR